jgi:PadR family transcriptional regulator, regulatory protein PadR
LTAQPIDEALQASEPASSFVPKAYLIKHIFKLGLTEPELYRFIIRPSMGLKKPKADLLPGTLDMLVLKVLMRGHLHGYAIAQLIQQLSDDLLRVEEGSLYPALQRLELNGWIEGEWGLSANNRRARFYKLTSDGRKHLAGESARYRQVTGAVARIMGFA